MQQTALKVACLFENLCKYSLMSNCNKLSHTNAINILLRYNSQ